MNPNAPWAFKIHCDICGRLFVLWVDSQRERNTLWMLRGSDRAYHGVCDACHARSQARRGKLTVEQLRRIDPYLLDFEESLK